MFRTLFAYRSLIHILVKRDFEGRYKNSVLSFCWPFLQPFFLTLTFWFVFTYGFRTAAEVKGIPFFLWLITGLVPWYFFSDAVSKGVISVVEYSYLIKNIQFPADILPIVKILSCLITHIFFLFLLAVIMLFYPVRPNLFTVPGTIYYMFCLISLAAVINYLTSSLFIMFKDTAEMIRIGINFLFWLTPVIWNGQVLKGNLKFLLYANPLAYIIDGYRNTLLYGMPFQHGHARTVAFWIMVLVLFWFSSKIYHKIKPDFADML